ncbi:hypothetical protein GEMRC1_003778 [Eukaryota sp. GEM-RC1]
MPENIRVSVRVRPFSSREVNLNATPTVSMADQIVTVEDPSAKNSRTFAFDTLFWSFDSSQKVATQADVFSQTGNAALQSLWEGYNSTVFAYGQSGSGKTYTLFGSESHPGLIPLFCKHLFSLFNSLTPSEQKNSSIHVSVLEVYNENIHDLLNTKNPHQLQVRECRTLGPFVPHLTNLCVKSYEQLSKVINSSFKNRTTFGTLLNHESSRSHCVVSISLKKCLDDGSEFTAKTHLVDLAGSERLSKTGATGARLKEAANINKSLLALGNVVAKLCEQAKNPGKNVFVSFRGSVLTRLLSSALGGNSKTFLIGTITSSSDDVPETLNTLSFCNRAKQIPVVPKVNKTKEAVIIEALEKKSRI